MLRYNEARFSRNRYLCQSPKKTGFIFSMLFNSHVFIFMFLPIVIFGMYCIGFRKKSSQVGVIWQIFSSLGFNAWWEYRFAPLLLLSVIFNYYVSGLLVKLKGDGRYEYRQDTVINFQKEFVEKIKQYELPFLSNCI